MRAERGFTLVELLIVIIIIAVLAAVVVPRFANSSIRAKESSLRMNLKLIRKTVDRFYQDTGLWPMQLTDIAASSAPAQGINGGGNIKPLQAASWRGPYLEGSVVDPVSEVILQYKTTPPKVGTVTSSAPGTASDGTAYASW